jgi:hypothetical protein
LRGFNRVGRLGAAAARGSGARRRWSGSVRGSHTFRKSSDPVSIISNDVGLKRLLRRIAHASLVRSNVIRGDQHRLRPRIAAARRRLSRILHRQYLGLVDASVLGRRGFRHDSAHRHRVSIAFVVVQFSAIAYSPRLVLWFAREPLLFHSIRVFVATFTYSLATLLWVDRGGSGTVPLFSLSLVAVLLGAVTPDDSRVISETTPTQFQALSLLHRRPEHERQQYDSGSRATETTSREMRASIGRMPC